MLADQHFECSLIEREKRKLSAFRPPKFFKSTPSQKNTLTATARPWYPPGAGGAERAAKPALAPPMAVGLSPVQKPKMNGNQLPELNELLSLSKSNSTLFSPLSTPVSAFFHSFSDAATAAQVYPIAMFLSARKDASHTPHGVLKWCVHQYVAIPTLKVPSHLRLSMNEAVNSDDGVTRGALGSGLKSKLRNKPIRQTHHKVMSVLSRITRAKYNELLEELVQLPLRQSDDAELQEVVKVFFDKSVLEHEYSDLYAQLVKELCSIKESERELDAKLQDRLLCNRIRTQLVAVCEEQFRRPIELTADEKVDRTTGKPFGEEEIEMKRMRMKNRLVGNIKFVGELYKLDLVTEGVVENILNLLVGSYDRTDPVAKEEYVFEVFATLIKTVAPILKDRHAYLLSHFLAVAKTVEASHPKPRVRFLMMDLGDLNIKNSWIAEKLVMREVNAWEEANALSRSTPASPLVTSGGSVHNGVSATKAHAMAASPRGLANNRATSFAYEELGGHNNGSSRSHATTQPHAQQQQQQPQRQPQYHAHQPQPLSSLPVSATTSASDFAFGLPRSRSSAASLQAIAGTNGAAATPTAAQSNGSSAAQTATGIGSRSTAASASAAALPIRTNTSNGSTANSARVYSPPGEGSRSGCMHNANSMGLLSPVHQASNSSLMSCTPAEKPSPFNSAISAGELSSARTSEGARTPVALRQHRIAMLTRCTAATGADVVNMQDVTRQLMEMYNDPVQAPNVLQCVKEMALRNKVCCLTWWLRLAATNTALFVERQRVTNLLCDVLSSCPAVKPEELFAAVVEWIRFDIEQGLYDNCPRMFDNIAHMVLYCHSPEASTLKNIAAARELLHSGLFNIMLHALTTDRGTDQMVTLVKGAYPVSVAMMGAFTDPAGDAAVLRLAAENRFRLLPYFLSVSNGTESELPGTPALGCRTPTTPSMRSPLGDSITSTVHYDPLSRCLSFQRVAEDPELHLFRKIRAESSDRSQNSCSTGSTSQGGGNGTGSASWRDEAIKLALAPVGNDSLASQVLQMMKVIGALLACTGVTHPSGSLLTFAEVDVAVRELLARRHGTIFEAAAVMELMMHFTQALKGGAASCPRKSTRIKPLRQAFARWCTQGVVNKGPAMELIRAVESSAPNPRVFTTYHNAIADTDLQWHGMLTCLS